MKIYKRLFTWVLLLLPLALGAQDGFGFGDSSGLPGASPLSVEIGGEVSAEGSVFFEDLASLDRFKKSSFGNIFSGRLNFKASASSAEAHINLKLKPVHDEVSSPLAFDEAYLRAFFGPITIEGGLRKITWGRADSYGPLDLINPLDFRDLSMLANPQEIKIARPMIRGIWSGNFSRVEALFVPWFQGHQFARDGRWAPEQFSQLPAALVESIFWDKNHTLEFAQGGMRFTGTIGSTDLGFQYYFGRLQRPALYFIFSPPSPIPMPEINYNHFHHLGLDFARVIAGFNLRAEAGVNITGDPDGTDGTIENPAMIWSLGFDRSLPGGIDLNLQGTGSIRLFHSKLDENPLLDIEAGADVSSTRISGIISRTFLGDSLELKATGLWGIEDRDFLVMPAIIWSQSDLSAELALGFFGGDREGELGQYRDNSFARIKLSYRF